MGGSTGRGSEWIEIKSSWTNTGSATMYSSYIVLYGNAGGRAPKFICIYFSSQRNARVQKQSGIHWNRQRVDLRIIFAKIWII